MKKIKLIYFTMVIMAFILSSCSEEVSKEVCIGKQVWMNKNLNVDKFRNGDPIPEAKTPEAWEEAKKNHHPVWCYYGNNSENGNEYGKLYNYYAVSDPRGLAPAGYHIPTSAEWTYLYAYCGNGVKAVEKLKTEMPSYNKLNGKNSNGFFALPCGQRHEDGYFNYVGEIGLWWSSTIQDTNIAKGFLIFFPEGGATIFNSYMGDGLSVRCIKD